MHPELSSPFRIGAATLTNGQSYPSVAGVRIDRMISTADVAGGPGKAMVGGAATFGTANLQRQVSFNGGATWLSDGAALTVATLVETSFARSGLYRWTVGGTGDITAAELYVG